MGYRKSQNRKKLNIKIIKKELINYYQFFFFYNVCKVCKLKFCNDLTRIITKYVQECQFVFRHLMFVILATLSML